MLEWLLYNYRTYGERVKKYYTKHHKVEEDTIIELRFNTDMSGYLVLVGDSVSISILVFDTLKEGVEKMHKVVSHVNEKTNFGRN